MPGAKNHPNILYPLPPFSFSLRLDRSLLLPLMMMMDVWDDNGARETL